MNADYIRGYLDATCEFQSTPLFYDEEKDSYHLGPGKSLSVDGRTVSITNAQGVKSFIECVDVERFFIEDNEMKVEYRPVKVI